ncbi:unnamed protein product [Arctogadus glacialis]
MQKELFWGGSREGLLQRMAQRLIKLFLLQYCFDIVLEWSNETLNVLSDGVSIMQLVGPEHKLNIVIVFRLSSAFAMV